MPASLFSLYIRSMALYEKNPGNDKGEKYLFWVFKTVGVVSIGLGIHGLYVYVPIVISQQTYLGWAFLSIAKPIVKIILGVGFLVYYKKAISLFSRRWICIPLIVGFSLSLLRKAIFYQQTMQNIFYEAICVFILIFIISYWVHARKKYPEEFGLKG